MKKLMTIGMLVLIYTGTVTFSGCKKDAETGPKGETGATGPQGPAGANGTNGSPGTNGTNGVNGSNGTTGATGVPGPDATCQMYALTFTTTQNFQIYTGFSGLYDAGDVIVTYIKNATYGGEDYYVALPYLAAGTVNCYAEIGETTGNIFIDTDKADGSAGSPWSQSVTLAFKSVLIKGHAMQQHPGVDLKNYDAVMRVFNLK